MKSPNHFLTVQWGGECLIQWGTLFQGSRVHNFIIKAQKYKRNYISESEEMEPISACPWGFVTKTKQPFAFTLQGSVESNSFGTERKKR